MRRSNYKNAVINILKCVRVIISLMFWKKLAEIWIFLLIDFYFVVFVLMMVGIERSQFVPIW